LPLFESNKTLTNREKRLRGRGRPSLTKKIFRLWIHAAYLPRFAYFLTIAQSWSVATCEQGKVEAELNLVSNEEKELNPVGIARKEPEPLPAPKYVSVILLLPFMKKTIFFCFSKCPIFR